MPLTVGIVGCGNISRFYFPGLLKRKVKIKWVCDLVQDVASGYVKKYQANFTKDYRDIVCDPEVDVVIVTSVTSSHKAICIDAIKQGKSIICEKTLANNPDDAFEIVSLAKNSKTILFTNYMKRHIPAVVQAKELLPSLGQIIVTNIRTFQPWGDLWQKNPAEGFFHTPHSGLSEVKKNYGGGILVCGGSHLIDLVLFFLGRPFRLYASLSTPQDRDYELQASALMETENGKVHFEALAHPLKKNGFLHDGWDEQVEIIGTSGSINIYSAFWDQSDSKASLLMHYDNKTQTSTQYRFDPVSPFEPAVEFYLDSIAQGKQEELSLLSGYEVDELIEHIQLSSNKKQALDIEWKL